MQLGPPAALGVGQLLLRGYRDSRVEHLGGDGTDRVEGETYRQGETRVRCCPVGIGTAGYSTWGGQGRRITRERASSPYLQAVACNQIQWDSEAHALVPTPHLVPCHKGHAIVHTARLGPRHNAHVSLPATLPTSCIHATFPTSGSIYPCTNPHLGLDVSMHQSPPRARRLHL